MSRYLTTTTSTAATTLEGVRKSPWLLVLPSTNAVSDGAGLRANLAPTTVPTWVHNASAASPFTRQKFRRRAQVPPKALQLLISGNAHKCAPHCFWRRPEARARGSIRLLVRVHQRRRHAGRDERARDGVEGGALGR
eukprot:7377352-Prymnesium_polylepis.2